MRRSHLMGCAYQQSATIRSASGKPGPAKSQRALPQDAITEALGDFASAAAHETVF